jgi:hypothetical protein
VAAIRQIINLIWKAGAPSLWQLHNIQHELERTQKPLPAATKQL